MGDTKVDSKGLLERVIDYKALYPFCDKTILIQIPAYKDKDILNTVYSALQQANFPERIHFAICYQDDDMRMLHKLKNVPNTKVYHMLPEDAKGACYARWCCQQLIDWEHPEDFTLHTDAHMRFSKGWDDLIIQKYMTFYDKDKKAIMSTYPPSNEWLDRKFDDEVFGISRESIAICANGFHQPNGHFIKLTPDVVKKDDPRCNARGIFVSGGYFFSVIDVDKDVLYDKYMLQLGDELPYGVRLFTHGYNVYIPDEIYAFHEYTREGADRPHIVDRSLHEVEFRRLDTLFDVCDDADKVDLGEFGLGTVRSLSDYTKFSGIDFKTHTIRYKATQCMFGENETACGNDVDFFRDREAKLFSILRKYKIHLVVYNMFDNKYDDTTAVQHALSKADKPSNINVIEIDGQSDDVCGVWQGKAMAALKKAGAKSNDYVLFVDNSTRFISHWDTNFVTSLFNSGEKCVLSNTGNTIQPDWDVNNLPLYDNFCVKLCNAALPLFDLEKGDMIMSQTSPTRHMFVTHNILFMKYSVIKTVPFDDTLNYRDFIISYSARLFTHGYDIFYPVHSYVCRYETEAATYARDSDKSDVTNLFPLFEDGTCGIRFKIDKCKNAFGTDRFIGQFAKLVGIEYKRNHVYIMNL
ncbi:hypothetical protein J6A31_06160 [bacterium]|nr:hypothetical protein [bacterium]